MDDSERERERIRIATASGIRRTLAALLGNESQRDRIIYEVAQQEGLLSEDGSSVPMWLAELVTRVVANMQAELEQWAERGGQI